MSDTFTQADAEALGWRFVHAQEASTVDLGDGISRYTAASYTAEKNSDSNSLITEQAETTSLLLERIRLYEEQLVVKQVAPEPAAPVVVAPSPAVSAVNDTIYDGTQTVQVTAGQVSQPEQGAWAEHDAVVGVDRTPPEPEPVAEPESADEKTAEVPQNEEQPVEQHDESVAQKVEGVVHDFLEGSDAKPDTPPAA